MLKSLILSKLVHLWLLLPNPPGDYIDTLQKRCFKFIWNNKQDRIKRKTVTKNVKQGGLDMFDLRRFICSLKLSWICKLRESKHKWKNIMYSLCPWIKDINKIGSHLPTDTESTNNFWMDIFLAYKEFNSKVTIKTSEDFLSESLFGNDRIKLGNKTILYKQWIDKGVFSIHNLFKETGKFMSHQEFQVTYGLSVNFITYHGIVQAVKKYQKAVGVKIEGVSFKNPNLTLQLIYSVRKGVKMYYDILNSETCELKCCKKWTEKLNVEIEWNKVFFKVKKIKEVRLKWLQVRLMHRILATNTVLFKMNLATSDQCQICREEKESIEHIFWQCYKVKNFWTSLTNYLKEKCLHIINLNLNEELVLFGYNKNSKTDEALDLILLLAKHFIYKCRLENTEAKLQNFLKYFKYRYKIEKHNATVKMEKEAFEKKWLLYQSFIE